MAKKRKNKKRPGFAGLGIIIILLSILFGISIYSYSTESDPGVFDRIIYAQSFNDILEIEVDNAGGVAGAAFAFILMTAFGKLTCLIPPLILLVGINIYRGRTRNILPSRVVLLVATLVLLTIILTVPLAGGGFDERLGYGYGGVFIYLLTKALKVAIGTTATYILAVIGMLIMLWMIFPKSTTVLMKRLYSVSKSLLNSFIKLVASLPAVTKKFYRSLKLRKKAKIKIVKPTVAVEAENLGINERIETPVKIEAVSEPEEHVEESGIKFQVPDGTYRYPDISLLDKPGTSTEGQTDEDINRRAGALKATLMTFGIRINEGSLESYPGPVITRFEFQPAAGIKLSQISALADDLAMAMKARSIRIIAPIPGKGAVGVEIPNDNPQTVYVSQILSSPAFRKPDHLIPLALGKDIGGNPFIADLARMPHLLIAGATGSGKSVCLNTIITSILFKLHPDQVRFIFIDPKRLELSVYSGIPHLERPVVTGPRQAEKVLKDTVEEMENRYGRLAEIGVRNIDEYNQKAGPSERLPYVVIIVDELADLMVGSANKIELMITRLAQMARAVGIHLILATQRPSVDVITGLIKANFSSRIAFQVASKVDSRTILDANGAEKLLGRGDMLVMLTGQPELIRVHGSYVSGEETARMVKFLQREDYTPRPIDSLQPVRTSADKSILSDDKDELLRHAAETVVVHKKGSVSLLQRRLGVGYQRAARLIDMLEEAGVVGPDVGSKARKVLINEQQLRNLFSGKNHVERN